MKKIFLLVSISLIALGVMINACGCAALWVTGAVAAGATAYDMATHRECPHCKKIIKRDIKTCPYCNKEVAPAAEKTKE